MTDETPQPAYYGNNMADGYGGYGYVMCSHGVCTKKAWRRMEDGYDHNCCGNSKHSTAHAYRERERNSQ
ncbi:hypothetical protein [Micromonospora sp. NPDC049301]|uniref:hypothetical protein n=1 Tax=Micromonospora sp. NPDC049301 TaxID=3155723 RepID=UPI00341B7833